MCVKTLAPIVLFVVLTLTSDSRAQQSGTSAAPSFMAIWLPPCHQLLGDGQAGSNSTWTYSRLTGKVNVARELFRFARSTRHLPRQGIPLPLKGSLK